MLTASWMQKAQCQKDSEGRKNRFLANLIFRRPRFDAKYGYISPHSTLSVPAHHEPDLSAAKL
jgi:hypothetical protein